MEECRSHSHLLRMEGMCGRKREGGPVHETIVADSGQRWRQLSPLDRKSDEQRTWRVTDVEWGRQ